MKPSVGEPCPRCLELYLDGKLARESVQPIPELAPFAAVPGGGRCCRDCASADTLVKLKMVPSFEHARAAVAQDRGEQLRLPGAPIGLVGRGLVRPSIEGDLVRHYEWLEANVPEDEEDSL